MTSHWIIVHKTSIVTVGSLQKVKGQSRRLGSSHSRGQQVETCQPIKLNGQGFASGPVWVPPCAKGPGSDMDLNLVKERYIVSYRISRYECCIVSYRNGDNSSPNTDDIPRFSSPSFMSAISRANRCRRRQQRE